MDQGWIVPSCASHAASVVFARNLKPDGTWRFCQDYRHVVPWAQRHHRAAVGGAAGPLQHVDQLVDETRGERFFTKLNLAMACIQFRICEEDRYKKIFMSSPTSPARDDCDLESRTRKATIRLRSTGNAKIQQPI